MANHIHSRRRSALALISAFCFGNPCLAQATDNTTPILRLEAGGPTTQITALAFGPDGKTLYAAGFDKVVRAWEYNPALRQFTVASAAYRVPIGPGDRGILNALAVSADGDWLATSGHGATRNDPSFREPGRLRDYKPSANSASALEESTIYLFHTRTKDVRILRGHGGAVRRLTFAPARAGKPVLLVSAAIEPALPGARETSIVRVWDVTKAAYLDEKEQLKDPGALVAELPLEVTPSEHVSLAMHHTGDQLKQLRVGIAWSDGQFRVWDVAANTVTAKPDGLAKWNNGVTALGSDRFLTSSVDTQQRVSLRTWAAGAVEPGEERTLAAPVPATLVAPRGLALASSRDDGQPDHAAVVAIGKFEGGLRACLQVVQLDNGQAAVTLPLWPYEGRTVILAASPRGDFLALAGEREPVVHVYNFRTLLEQREKASPQKLQGVGVSVESLAFVQKADSKDLGLFLGDRATRSVDPAQDAGRILDFANRKLIGGADRANWRLDDPVSDEWRVLESKPVSEQGRNRQSIDWQGSSGRKQTTLDLDTDAQITSLKVVPPSQPNKLPLLAVATWNRLASQAALTLYRADTGEALRRLDAHVQPIRALGATRDGRLLASTADDRQVCVWSLTGLDQILGRFGRIQGLYLQQRGADVVVADVKPGSPAQDRLQSGDLVTGLVLADGKQQPLKQAFEYYNAIDRQKPGTKVKLQFRRDGQASEAEVAVSQGVDAPKPLFSLFFTATAAGEYDWIAWTPLGPFDSSGERIERHVGWHFNPKQLEGPVRFAPLEQYRKQFRRETLLKPLVALADIHKAIELVERPVPLPRPELECFLENTNQELMEPDQHGHYLVREPKAHISVTVRGPSLAEKQVERVGWRLLEQAAPFTVLPLDKASGQELIATVPLPDKAALYTLQLELVTREDTPQTIRKEVLVRFQPPPPRLTFDRTWQQRYYPGGLEAPTTVAEARFPLRVEAGSKAKVSLWHNGKQILSQPAQLEHTVDLKQGENVLEVRAANSGALAGFEEQEETRQPLVVQYRKKPAPTIALLTLVALTGPKVPTRIRCGECMRVDWHQVQVAGEVKNLDKGEPIVILDSTGKTVARFTLQEGQTQFEEKLSLQPGEQELRFQARSAAGETGEASVTLEYRPPLPELVLARPDHTLREGESPARQVDLEGFFVPAPDTRPFQATVAVFNQGKKVPQENGQEEIKLAYDAQNLQNLPARGQSASLAKLRLAPGLNRIQVTLANPWKGLATYEARVNYLRPPKIMKLENKAPADQASAKLVAQVESATPLTRVVCGECAHPIQQVVKRIEEAGRSLYEVTLPDVPLAAGENLLRLQIHNEDGPSLEEGKLHVAFDPRTNETARIVVSKAAEGAVKDARVALNFEVRSFSPLSKVVVRRGEHEVLTLPVDKAKQATEGQYVLLGTTLLDLDMGSNCFTIEAVNKAGRVSDEIAICRVREPVRVDLELSREAVAEPLHTLRGTATWAMPDEGEEVKKKLQSLRVVVNGFRQRGNIELSASPDKPTQVTFKIPILLNRPANDIKVICDLPQDPAFQKAFSVMCTSPREPVQLHLFLVCVGVYGQEAKEKLVENAFRALQIEARDQKVRSPVFREVVVHPYRPGQARRYFMGDVHRGQVMWELERLDKRGSPNDVVLIYWLGPDAQKDSTDAEYYLPTADSLPGNPIRNTGVPLKQLMEGSTQTAGARLLLLDVASPVSPGQQTRLELPVTQTALLRHAWSRGEPAPGLLQALEQAVTRGKAVSLRELVEAAQQMDRAPREVVRLFSNLDGVLPLSTLILTQPAVKP